jgi:Peptidase inhibitor I9
MIRRLILAIGLLLSGTNLLSAQSTDSIATTLNPHKQNRMPLEKFLRATNQKKRILNQYIVVLTDAAAGPRGKSSRAPQLTDLMVRMHGAHLIYRYSYALNGFAAKMTEEEAHRLSEEPEVAYCRRRPADRASGKLADTCPLGTRPCRPAFSAPQ